MSWLHLNAVAEEQVEIQVEIFEDLITISANINACYASAWGAPLSQRYLCYALAWGRALSQRYLGWELSLYKPVLLKDDMQGGVKQDTNRTAGC